MYDEANQLYHRSQLLRCRLIAMLLVVLALVSCHFSKCLLANETAKSAESASQEARNLSADELAVWIDQQLSRSWQAQGITPALVTTDAEFVRRVYLDLVGRIPSVAEVRLFLANTEPDRRLRLVDELLQRGAFAAHLANTWRDLLLSGNTDPQARAQAPALETWLKLRFSSNMPYDQLASELLTASLEPGSARNPSALAFYQAAEFKPEQLAANVSKVFLGVQVQCAQCHDHPFAGWKQPQFWSFAAFFKNVQPRGDGAMMRATSGELDEIQIPGKDILVPAAFLDGARPERINRPDKRSQVAEWMTGAENPFFARAVVNRVWGNFFGRGFVHPIDDLDPANVPLFPEVFAEICRQFRSHRCDLKYLVRTITLTQAYQLSSRSRTADDQLVGNFARMPLKRMTSDQLYASFVQATGFRETIPTRQNVVIGNNSARDEFQSKFADSTVTSTEIETTILQALSLMNGRYVADAVDLSQSEFLSSVAESPFLDAASKVESVFLATLSRFPVQDELNYFLKAENQADQKSNDVDLQDLFWTLLNSAEFLLNH